MVVVVVVVVVMVLVGGVVCCVLCVISCYGRDSDGVYVLCDCLEVLV